MGLDNPTVETMAARVAERLGVREGSLDRVLLDAFVAGWFAAGWVATTEPWEVPVAVASAWEGWRRARFPLPDLSVSS